MKKIYTVLLTAAVLASSCQKSITDFDPSQTPSTNPGTATPTGGTGSFVATIDGKALNFSITAATLLRSTTYNEKRMDITGTTTDNKQRLIITLGEETAKGNAMTLKTYVLNAFPDDDPSTPTVDESLTTQGFTTYGTASGSNWLYNVYGENGSFTMSSCDSTSKQLSGTFQTTLTDLIDTTHIVKITAGKLTNVKYTVLN